MEDVAGVEIEPAHVGVAAGARHHPDTGTSLGLPGEDAAPAREVLEAEDDRAEDEHDGIRGDREIVHHRWPGEIDRLAAHEGAGAVDLVEREIGWERRVAEEEHLPGLGVELRM